MNRSTARSTAIGIFIGTTIPKNFDDISWDILHQAIDKIELLGYSVSMNKECVFIGETSQQFSSSYVTPYVGTGASKKEKAWSSIGEFCIFYNGDGSFDGKYDGKKRCIVRIEGKESTWLTSLMMDGDPPRTTDRNLALKFTSEVAARLAIDAALLTHPLKFRHYVIDKWEQEQKNV